MSGPDLCPKCKGLHFRNAPCVVRRPKLGKEKCSTTGTLENTEITGLPSQSRYGSSVTDGPPKRPVGRPKTIKDMKAYKAAKAREYRARKAK